jgi:hypothetical protein
VSTSAARVACPDCGLAFTDGKRTLSTYGRPTITLEQHLAYHAEQDARAAELEAAMRSQNALPQVEAHQSTERLCEERCRQAEEQVAIRLPVVVPSRTTMQRPSGDAILLDESSLPLPSRLARHRSVYGGEGCDHMPEDRAMPKLRSRSTRRRRPTRLEVSGPA